MPDSASRTRPAPLSHLLVIAQLGGVVLSCYPTASQGAYAWLVLCAAGAALGVITLYFNRPGNFSIYPELRRGAALITRGPYRYVRHPMYLALVTMMLGVAAYNGAWFNAAGVVLITAAVIGKAHLEERLLLAGFPDYATYAARTGRFLPRLR